jgi:hypothetical protein
MTRYFLAILLFAHVGLVMMLLGAGILDTYVLFPNWFYDIPNSLLAAREFMRVHNPGAFFIPVQLAVMISGAAFTVAAWRREPAKLYVLIGTVVWVLIMLLNLAFIYPRFSIFFGAPLANNDFDLLNRTAQEFQVLLQVRMVLGVIASGFSVFALWRFNENAPKPVIPAVTESVENS